MNFSVLAVDDDNFLLLTTQINPCQPPVSLTYASNGLEATQRLQDGLQPNLILVDAQMLLMDGYEFLGWIRASEP